MRRNPLNTTAFAPAARILVAWVFLFSSVLPVAPVRAQEVLGLPRPGTMVRRTPDFVPPFLKGMTVNLDNPFQFDFIVDAGNSGLAGDDLTDATHQLVNYFLATLTIPEDDLWVNLSPYEGDRIIPEELGKTEMGWGLLAQDYMLKQLTASLLYPEEDLGEKFWKTIYAKAQQTFGTTEIPVNTFHKVWIVPDKAVVYEHGTTVIITESHLKVLLERDYQAAHQYLQPAPVRQEPEQQKEAVDPLAELSSQVTRDVIIPEIEREVNEGETFAELRQIYHSMILATWYKKKLRNSPLAAIYTDQKKIEGIESADPTVTNKIYQQYVQAFRQGVYDYIKKEQDPYQNKTVYRKYFSGGVAPLRSEMIVSSPTTPRDDDLQPTDPSVGFAIGRVDLTPQGLSSGANLSQGTTFDIYGHTTAADWLEAIQTDQRWQPGVDFKALRGDNQIMILADTNHDRTGIQQGLLKILSDLKDAGVTHLGLEIPADLKIADIDTIARHSWNPGFLRELVAQTQALGIEIEFIDLPLSERDPKWDTETLDVQRGIYMGAVLSQFAKTNPQSVMAAVPGYAHVEDNRQIPTQLATAEIRHIILPVVTAGQENAISAQMRMALFSLPIVEAIRQLTRSTAESRYGTVSLKGLPFDVPGAAAIIHFPRPQKRSASAVEERRLQTEATTSEGRDLVAASDWFSQIGPVQKLPDSGFTDFSRRVDGSSYTRRASNEEKITEFISTLTGISLGQKFYLTALLLSYAIKELPHSIVDIGFDNTRQMFEITTVETFEHEYDPDYDYGTQKQDRMISLQDLQDKYGFANVLVDDIADLDDIPIRNNPDRPLSLIKILQLVLTARKYPDLVQVAFEDLAPTFVNVFTPARTLLTQLRLDDFSLSASEQAFLDAAAVAFKISTSLEAIAWTMDPRDAPGLFSPLKRRSFFALKSTLMAARFTTSIKMGDAFRLAILQSRKDLTFLPASDEQRLLAELDKAIAQVTAVIEKGRDYAAADPDFASMGMTSNATSLEQIQYLLAKLRSARGRVQAYPALTSGENSLLISGPGEQRGTLGLSESAVPAEQDGFTRFYYFTGAMEWQDLRRMMTEGIPLTGLGENLDLWRMASPQFQFADYMFQERRGQRGYVVMVDVPDGLLGQIETGPNYWKDLRTELTSQEAADEAAGPRLLTEFVVGAIHQETGQWSDREQIVSSPGGIDLNARWLDLQNLGPESAWSFNTSVVPGVEIQGFTPTITSLSTLPSLAPLLGQTQ